jgi:hypothetical protein
MMRGAPVVVTEVAVVVGLVLVGLVVVMTEGEEQRERVHLQVVGLMVVVVAMCEHRVEVAVEAAVEVAVVGHTGQSLVHP